MKTYKLQVGSLTGEVCSIIRSDGWNIPLDSANTDYANFKRDIAEEKAELQDADGNVMTAEEAKAYIATLP